MNCIQRYYKLMINIIMFERKDGTQLSNKVASDGCSIMHVKELERINVNVIFLFCS